MATKVNMGTQRAYGMIADFNRKYYKGETLYDCYKSVSSAKVRSWEAIKRQCEELNGYNLHITGAGSHMYSCIYAFDQIDDNTGELLSVTIRKETAGNTYDLVLTVDDYLKYITVKH